MANQPDPNNVGGGGATGPAVETGPGKLSQGLAAVGRGGRKVGGFALWAVPVILLIGGLAYGVGWVANSGVGCLGSSQEPKKEWRKTTVVEDEDGMHYKDEGYKKLDKKPPVNLGPWNTPPSVPRAVPPASGVGGGGLVPNSFRSDRNC